MNHPAGFPLLRIQLHFLLAVESGRQLQSLLCWYSSPCSSLYIFTASRKRSWDIQDSGICCFNAFSVKLLAHPSSQQQQMGLQAAMPVHHHKGALQQRLAVTLGNTPKMLCSRFDELLCVRGNIGDTDDGIVTRSVMYLFDQMQKANSGCKYTFRFATATAKHQDSIPAHVLH